MLLQEGFDVLAVTYAALSNFHCAEDTSEEKEGCHISFCLVTAFFNIIVSAGHNSNPETVLTIMT